MNARVKLGRVQINCTPNIFQYGNCHVQGC